MSRQVIGPVERFDEIDSTNRYLADRARTGAPSGLVAVVRFQTAGRGRLDRSWEAPPGANLLMSVLLRPETADFEPFHFTVATALAASDACRSTARVDAGLKWPNDLVVDGRLDPQGLPPGGSEVAEVAEQGVLPELKLAGILAELVTGAGLDGSPAVVVGLGLNVGWPGPEPAEPEMRGATSLSRLSSLSDRPLDPDSIAEAVLDHLDRRITDLFLQGGAERLIEEYRERCVTLGRLVRVEEPGGTYVGRAERITDQGHLVVDSEDRAGARHREVTAADVVHLRHVHAEGLSGAP